MANNSTSELITSASRITVAGMTHEDWLALRRNGIGGSDAAAVMGASPWMTRDDLIQDKLGLLPEKKDNEAMRQGRDLEPYVAHRFELATGKETYKPPYMYFSTVCPWAYANVDYLITGESAGLECKTTTLCPEAFAGDFPVSYAHQCMHYLAVTGLERWYLAVLCLGQGFKWFVMDRNDKGTAEGISLLLHSEERLWEKVLSERRKLYQGQESKS